MRTIIGGTMMVWALVAMAQSEGLSFGNYSSGQLGDRTVVFKYGEYRNDLTGEVLDSGVWAYDTESRSEQKIIDGVSDVNHILFLESGETNYLGFEHGNPRRWSWYQLIGWPDGWVQVDTPDTGCPGIQQDGWCFASSYDTQPLHGCPAEGEVIPECFHTPALTWPHSGSATSVVIRVFIDETGYNFTTVLDAVLECGSDLDPRVEFKICGGHGTAWFSPPNRHGDPVTGSLQVEVQQNGAVIYGPVWKVFY